MSASAPTATGTLSATPLSHLLVYLLDRQLTGTLVLEDPQKKRSAIHFEEGAATKAKTADPVCFLGDVLASLGLVKHEAKERTLAVARAEKRLHGQILLRERLLDAEGLKQGLREQLAVQLASLCRLPPQTLFGYYEGINYLESWGGPSAPRAKALSLIWRLIRENERSDRVDALVARLNGELRLHLDAQLPRFHFTPKEQGVVEVLRAKPQSLAELARRGLIAEDVLKKLVYTLALTRHLDLGATNNEPVGLDDAPSSTRIPVAEPVRPGARFVAEAHGVRGARTTDPLAGVSVPRAGGSRASPSSKPARTGATPSPGSAAPPGTRGTDAPVKRSSSGERVSAAAAVVGTPPSRISVPAPAPASAKAPAKGSLSPAKGSLSPGGRESPSSASLRAAQAPTTLEELRKELVQFDDLAPDDHYGALGISPTATPAEIQHAFFSLAKRFHPDRLGPNLEPARNQVTRIFSKMSEAHQVLSNPTSRVRYDESLQQRGDDPEQAAVQAVLRAATSFQKAEVLLKKRDYAGAEEEARRALEGDPGQADYIALLAWIQVQSPNVADYQPFVKELNRAVDREPDNLRVRWYRGQILKRTGNLGRAMRDFRHIVELNPNHVDAQRELRLHEMRKMGTSSHPPGKGGDEGKGLFGKWFKR